MYSKLPYELSRFGIMLAIVVTALAIGIAPAAANDCQKAAQASDEYTNDCQAGSADQIATGDDPISDTGKDAGDAVGEGADSTGADVNDALGDVADGAGDRLTENLRRHGNTITAVEQTGVAEPDHMSRADDMYADS